MGRKKSRQVQRTVIKQKVDTVFDCPFCNDTKTVEVSMDHNHGVADIKCRVCLAKFQTEIHHLTEPIDVYCEWIDECDKLNKKLNQPEEHKSVDEDEVDEEEEKPYIPTDKKQVKNLDDEDDEDEYVAPKKRFSKKPTKKEVFADEEDYDDE